MRCERAERQFGLGAVILAVVGGLFVLAASLAATGYLWRHALLHLRSPTIVGVALVAHVFWRERPSILVAGLHLAALESCITDRMSTGTWATGWGNAAALSLSTPTAFPLLMMACSTALGYRRLLTSSHHLRRVCRLR